MKKMRNSLIFYALLFSVMIWAQDSNTEMYWVHEARVKPSMMQEFEKAVKTVVDHCQEHKVSTLGWITTQTYDHRFMFVSPINSMADINNEDWEPLQEAMGEEAFGQLFANVDKCTTGNGDYVLILNKELSYMPDGITQTPEGKDYRRFYYVRTTPEHFGTLKEKMMAVRDLYAKKNSPVHYRVYQSGFGNMGNYYMVAVAAKDGIDFETMDEENRKLLGEEVPEVFGDMMQYVTAVDEVTGIMRPDLAYSAEE